MKAQVLNLRQINLAALVMFGMLLSVFLLPVHFSSAESENGMRGYPINEKQISKTASNEADLLRTLILKLQEKINELENSKKIPDKKEVSTKTVISDGDSLRTLIPKIQERIKSLENSKKIPDRTNKKEYSTSTESRISTTSDNTLGEFKGYFSNGFNLTTNRTTKSTALRSCKEAVRQNPTKDMYCTWNEELIYGAKPTSPVVEDPDYQIVNITETRNPTIWVQANNDATATIIVEDNKGKVVYTKDGFKLVKGKKSSHYVSTELNAEVYLAILKIDGKEITKNFRVTERADWGPTTPEKPAFPSKPTTSTTTVKPPTTTTTTTPPPAPTPTPTTVKPPTTTTPPKPPSYYYEGGRGGDIRGAATTNPEQLLATILVGLLQILESIE